MSGEHQIGATTFTTPSDRELSMTYVFAAPRRLVFAAWTGPEHLRQWLLGPDGWTMTVCAIDLRPAGEWRFGWRHENGHEMGMTGVYREVLAPERLVSTERWGGDWPETVNTLVITEESGETTMTNTVLYPSQAARDAAIHTGMKYGVAASFDRLAEHLKTMG